MLFRCNVEPENGLTDLNTCSLLGRLLKTRGQRVAYAINREGFSSARAFLGPEETIYRLPDQLEEDAERLSHLGRTHKHKVVFIALRRADSAYLFHVFRTFDFTAVLDRGAPYLIYANLLINPTLEAHAVRYNCIQEARLLMGPRYHICEAAPVAPPQWPEPPQKVLLNLPTSPPLLDEVVDALAGLAGGPELDLLMPDNSGRETLDLRIAAIPGAGANIIVPPPGQAFDYHHYPLIITEAGEICLEFAHQGLCFVTVATRKEAVARAYALDQLGVAPTLGWHTSKKAPEIRKTLAGLLKDPERRQRLSRAGRQLIDGQGILRIAKFIPDERDSR